MIKGEKGIPIEELNPDLLPRVRKGDRAAFDELVMAYRKQAFSVAYRMVKNQSDAEDLSQEAFIKAYQNIGRFEGNSSFYTWFYRILINLCLDFLRKNKRRPEKTSIDWDENGDCAAESNPAFAAPASMNPDEQVIRGEAGNEILKAMEKLSPQQKLVFQLKHMDGFKIGEIAEITGQSEGTVKTHLFRAMERLKSSLTERGVTL